MPFPQYSRAVDSMGRLLLQNPFGRKRSTYWVAHGNSTTATMFGLAAPTTLGTATARNVTATVTGRERRLGYVSAITAAAFAGHYQTVAQVTGHDISTGFGGFDYYFRFMVSDAATVSGARMFVGLRAAVSAPANVEPSTLVNCIGLAALSTGTNLRIVYGGTAAQTSIDLGADFPANTLSSDVYELNLYSGGAAGYSYVVTRLTTGHAAQGTLTGTAAQVPAPSVFLGHAAWRCNNATLAAVGLDVSQLYIET